MGKKHPTFQTGDVVIPTVKGREAGVEPAMYLVLEILRGPGMRVRSTRSRRGVKVMRKHFELFIPVEERVAEALMGGGE